MKYPSLVAAGLALLLILGLAGVGAATGLGKYHDADRALADGYGDDPGEVLCVPNMGIHYIDFSLVDGDLSVSEPESFVYAQDGDDLMLLGAEYLAPFEFSLFGQHAHAIPGEPLWGLHFWFAEPNDNGLHAELHSSVDVNCDFTG